MTKKEILNDEVKDNSTEETVLTESEVENTDIEKNTDAKVPEEEKKTDTENEAERAPDSESDTKEETAPEKPIEEKENRRYGRAVNIEGGVSGLAAQKRRAYERQEEISFEEDSGRAMQRLYSSMQTGRILRGEIISCEYIDRKAYPVIFESGVKVLILTDEITDQIPKNFINGFAERLIGLTIDYVILKVDQDEGVAYGSRLEVLKNERERILPLLEEGKIYEGEIVEIIGKILYANFFGFDFAFKRSDLDTDLQGTLKSRYKPGEKIPGKLTEYDPKKGIVRISPRAALKSPFDEFLSRGFVRGSVLMGRIQNDKLPYGLIVSLFLGDGKTCPVLCEFPKLNAEIRFRDKVMVRVTGINHGKKRLRGNILSVSDLSERK